MSAKLDDTLPFGMLVKHYTDQWQKDQREYFNDTIIEIVSEYATWFLKNMEINVQKYGSEEGLTFSILADVQSVSVEDDGSFTARIAYD